jgi:uncharacterized protein (UPF0248 family)
MYPTDILNKIKWTRRSDTNEISIVYRDRGSKNDEKTFLYSDIDEIIKSWITLLPDKNGVETTIPEHRILRILQKNEIIWERTNPKVLNWK